MIDGGRIMARIGRLASFTEPDRPFTRRAFTGQYVQARDWLAGEFRAAGLEPRVDAGANLLGERRGTEPERGALLLGSHIDTVTGGGRFDGIAGVIAALEVAQVLHENGVKLRHDLVIADFLSEEPSDYGASCVGSSALAGTLSPAMLSRTNPAGESLAAALRRMGGDPARLDRPLVGPGDVAAYLELHIEQGPVLQRSGEPLGIVSGIVGIERRLVTITGRAGHAGTTPMNMRADALVGAARFTDLVWRRASDRAREQPFVATIGRFDVHPNGANVVPGRVGLVLEARSMDDALTAGFIEDVCREGDVICRQLGLEFSDVQESFTPAVACDSGLRQLLAACATQRGYGYVELMSGAGHDAMQVAAVAPVAMIFVPCDDGISHNPEENAHEHQLVAGAEVMLGTVLQLDGQHQVE